LVHVTDTALDQFELLREANELPADQAIALVPRSASEIGFVAAAPQPDDEVIERDGQPVFFVPSDFVEPFTSLVVDYVDTPEAQGFTISQAE
jgi:hypothetical protein